jgi:SAM-dependent methyltransferase
MDADLKKTLRSVTLELRHLLEGRYDSAGKWKPGDLEQRLAAIGVRRDRASVPVDELGHLADEDRQARKVVDAYVKLREEAGVERSEAVADFVRETAYTWANRLLALRCMEARDLIDSVILQQEAYGGRSLEHHRLAQRHPELCAGDDDGLFAVLDKVFREQAERLPMLFDPQAPGVALRPEPAALKDCVGLLSLNPDTLRKHRIRLKEDDTADRSEPPTPFAPPDALGWAYQYWNTEAKDRVFEKVRTVKGAKIAGADIVPATQLYTEDYMVKFLVQNSLGATWMGMHPESKLAANWEYYVKDADRAPVERKSVQEITFLDPACGSGHFHLEAFDLLYAMYREEGELTEPGAICTAILTKNLFGIDIDPRAVQIAEASLWMKAAERAFDYKGAATNLVAATSSHLKGEAWEEFLASFEREPSVARVLRKFAQTMEHIDEIGSLARPAEDLREIIKEEHATWERQVSEKKEANFLFAEMNEDATSGQLPFHEISDEEFGERLFYRARAGIDAFTERARATGEFEDQMLGSETRAGFRLLDLLSVHYDVVAANPPYMGSKNMGPVLKSFVERNFRAGKRDLYAAFILRNLELASGGGRVAMVTQQSWMFLRSFADLRAVEADDLDQIASGAPRGVLRETTIETLAHLGPNAFGEITGEVVNCALFVLAAAEPIADHRLTAFRLIGPKSPEEKDRLLHDALLDSRNPARSNPMQNLFVEIPQSPLCYWLRSRFFDLLQGLAVGDVAHTARGLDTSDIQRFSLWFWEVRPTTDRWVPFYRGGRYQKWAGLNSSVVDWQHNGRRIKQRAGCAVRNEPLYFQPGLEYSFTASGCLGLRVMSTPGIFAGGFASACIPREKRLGLAAVLNTRLSSYLIRSISAKIQLTESYVARVPLPLNDVPRIGAFEAVLVNLKQRLVASELTELTFDPAYRSQGISRQILVSLIFASYIATLESISEREVLVAYSIAGADLQAVLDETGTPSGWFPSHEVFMGELENAGKLLDSLADEERQSASFIELKNLKRRLRALYEAGRGATVNEDEDESAPSDDDEDSEAVAVGARIPIPPETLLEEFSQKLEIHPFSVYWLLKEGIEREGWRCHPEEHRLWGDRTTVAVLRQLGHRWPKQIESDEPIPDWADPDGIIPLAPLSKESTLPERVQQRLKVAEIDASDFAEVMGKPLGAWLATEFFKHHTKQFKKRPIAWQLQSSTFTARASPAFACMLYYHKLDADTLPKLRSQYVSPLRQRLETELRGITAVAADARSERQEKRRAELEDLIVELQRFGTILETVAATGFGPQSLASRRRQFAIDEGMLVLKARWLRRMTELVAKDPLPKWLDAADRAELHPDLRNWVAEAMRHLDYFCSKVGPDPPDQSKVVVDPTASDLANLISPKANAMLKDSLELACDEWWKRFEEVVLAPDKQRIKELKEEQKGYEEQLATDPAPSGAEARNLKYRVKEIKEEVKTLTAQIKKRTARASHVRTEIESWSSIEPRGWGNWLAEQPLFDRISSLDGCRAAPTTIAEFMAQESLYAPDINDGVRVNIAPLQRAGILAADVLAAKDIDKAIADRAEWRADERRWVREGKLPQPGWWAENGD